MLGKLKLGLGLDFSQLDSDISTASDRISTIGGNSAVAVGGASSGPGGQGQSTAGADGAAMASRLGPQIRAAIEAGLAPLRSLGATLAGQLDAIGGTVVTLARRIDNAMKFPAADRAVKALKGLITDSMEAAAKKAAADLNALERAVLRFGPAAKLAASGFLAFRGFTGILGSIGDVAGKSLSQIKGFGAVSFNPAVAGARALGAAVGAVEAPVRQVTATVKGLGREIALSLGAFSLVSKAIGFFVGGIKGASDLNETLSKTQIIFGDSAKVITTEADRMARSFGVAKNEFMTAAGNFGAVFKGVGKSQEDAAKLGNTLAKLGMDMASFDNSTNEEAFTAISSALRGEFDPIEKFRVFLTADAIAAEALASGLIKNKKELDETAKKQATLNMIMRQSADAQGDIERTIDGAANQFRKAGGGVANFATAIGDLLLPAVNTGTTAFNELLATTLEVFEANKPMIQGWADNLKTVMEGVGLLFRNFGTFTQMAWLRFVEFSANVTAALETIPANLKVLADFVSRDWANALRFGLDFVLTLFVNVGENLRNLGSAIIEFMQNPTGGFKFEFKGLTEGFQAAAYGLPEAVKPAWVSMQAEIDKLGAEMADKEARRAAGLAKAVAPKKAAADALKKPEKEDQLKLAGAAEQGSKEAYKTLALFAAGSGRGDDGIKGVAKNGRDQLDEARKQTPILTRIADKLAGNGAGETYSFA